MSAFVAERDADSYVGECKKKDDRYGLAAMKYEYYTQQIMIQHAITGV